MKLRPFELALVLGFGLLGFAAIIFLALYTPPEDVTEEELAVQGQVMIWGTLPGTAITPIIEEIARTNDSYSNVFYRYISPDTFDDQLLNALADNAGPDLVLVSHERLVQLQRRLQPISYDSFTLPDFRNIYLDGAGIYTFSDGLYALPVAVDPLLMYWNRDILFNAQILTPPRTWEELVNVTFDELIDRTNDRTINRSVVAFGEAVNIRNTFGVISALLLQADSRFVEINGGRYEVALNSSYSGTANPLVSVLQFYTSFANPTSRLYSWNRSLPEDRTQFLRENLAFYFGLMSEGPQIAALNPNLNFDVSEIPQGEGSDLRRTYGSFYGFSVLRVSRNQRSALNVAFELSSAANANRIARSVGMAPVFRQTVAAGSNDVYGRIGYQAATVAYGWRNPNFSTTLSLLRGTIEDINANREGATGAARDLEGRLELAF